MFEWNDKYNVGIELIDEQHQKLFEIAYRIHSLSRDQYSVDKYDEIIDLLNELKEYTIYHFKAEEEYMEKIKYKRYFTHKIEHNDFIEKMESFSVNNIDEDQEEYVEKMLSFVAEWIVNHILEKDKAIAME